MKFPGVISLRKDLPICAIPNGSFFRATAWIAAAIQAVARKKLPFGIAQIGKSFRNEITPGNFIFRTREFEQMEMEFFVEPGSDDEWFAYWVEQRMNWFLDLGVSKE